MARFGIFRKSVLYHGTSVENLAEVTPQGKSQFAFATPDIELAKIHAIKHGLDNARVYEVKPKDPKEMKSSKSLGDKFVKSNVGFDVVKEVKNAKNWWD